MTTEAIRLAQAQDDAAIRTLVRSERLNPYNLNWQNFLLACDGPQIIGAVQMRRHGDGSNELGSLVVAPGRRGCGLAGRLITALLRAEAGPVFMVTGSPYASHYAHWGFALVRPQEAPRKIRLNYLLGQAAGGVHALVMRRPVNRLVILRRASP